MENQNAIKMEWKTQIRGGGQGGYASSYPMCGSLFFHNAGLACSWEATAVLFPASTAVAVARFINDILRKRGNMGDGRLVHGSSTVPAKWEDILEAKRYR